MFVIDEETGGNGSLALADGTDLKARYDSLLVLECTGNRIHPGDRGAVFINAKVDLRMREGLGQVTPSLLEAFALAILALLGEGRGDRAGGSPALPASPRAACTGILGPFGVHPSAIWGKVIFEVIFRAADGAGGQMNVWTGIRPQDSLRRKVPANI